MWILPKQLITSASVSGYEGIGIGLRTVLPNLREIAFVEIEAFNIANLVAKMEEGKIHAAPIHTDIKTFPYGRISWMRGHPLWRIPVPAILSCWKASSN